MTVNLNAQTSAPHVNNLAIASLVSSPFVPGLSIALAMRSLSEISHSGERGRGLALGGLVVGSVVTFAWLLVAAAVVVLPTYAWMALFTDYL